MPLDPGEPLTKITLNIFRRDMDLLRQRYPRGGHLVFIKRLLRAWADAERALAEVAGETLEEAIAHHDEALKTLNTLERKFP